MRLEPLKLSHAPDLLSALTNDASIWQWLSIEPPLDLASMEAYIGLSWVTTLRTEKKGPLASLRLDDQFT